MKKKEQILNLLRENSNDIDNFNSAIFEDDYNNIADSIIKLFAIPNVSNNKVVVCGHPKDKIWTYNNKAFCANCNNWLSF